MKYKKLMISMILLMILMAMIVHSVVTGNLVRPADEFYLIKGGSTMGNISFEANATPSGASGNITNVSLYHNISGTWGVNYTNTTDAASGVEVNIIFAAHATSILSDELSNGLVFDWNIYACDNITKFYNEDVSLNSDEFVIFDNYTTTCGSNCSNSEIVTAGRGRVSNYPVSTLDGVANTTDEGISGCQLNGSTDGFFYCNQTRKTYNGSDGLLSTVNLITSSVKVNYTISSSCRFLGANRTVFVEDAPTITLNLPTDSSYDTDGTISINFSVTGDSDVYTCQVWSNDTGTWNEEEGANTAINNTDKIASTVISENNGVVWNVRCSESANSNIYGWGVSNYTLTVDKTDPAVTASAEDYSKFTVASDTFSAFVNLTVVDLNADSCVLFINGTSNRTESYTSNTPKAIYFNASDGAYNWMLTCNDTASRSTSTTNTSIVIDTITPSLSSKTNGSDITDCEAWDLNFTLNEIANFTLEYGLSDNSRTYSDIETDYETTQVLTLSFNDTYETTFYSNFTFCDQAGNCNTTEAGTFISPIPLCTGWNLWSVYDSAINLSDYRVASGADFVYYWNNTGQSWIYSSAAGSLNEDHNMIVGDVVHLFESTNTTYFRNNTGTSAYHVNVTGGHVYFGLYNEYSFGNISYVILKNDSGGDITPDTTWTGGLNFSDISYLSSFNNSGQEYVDSIYTWTWNNETTLGKNYKNGLDSLWAYINYSVAINFTPNGEIFGNWT